MISLIDITDNTTGIFIENYIWNSLPQGTFNLELIANDSVGNMNDFIKLSLSKDTIGPNITINEPTENQKITRNAPYFDLSIIDENGIGSSWYSLDNGSTFIYFTGTIGRIDQNLWERIWDNLTHGGIINIRFYSKKRNTGIEPVGNGRPQLEWKICIYTSHQCH